MGWKVTQSPWEGKALVQELDPALALDAPGSLRDAGLAPPHSPFP